MLISFLGMVLGFANFKTRFSVFPQVLNVLYILVIHILDIYSIYYYIIYIVTLYL